MNFRFSIFDLRLSRNRESARVRAGQSKIKNQKSKIPSAFTLTEILIVIAIIVLMLALAVPAFNFITGSRSQNGAENIIAAMLGRARAYAVTNSVDTGVVFFVEPSTGKTTMALVTRGISPAAPGSTAPSAGGEDPYYNYRGWSVNSFANAPGVQPVFGPTQYFQTHETIWASPDLTNRQGYPVENTLIVERFNATQNHTANLGNQPLSNVWQGSGIASSINGGPSGGNGNGVIDLLPDSDFQALPPGVGCQLINDPKDVAGGTNPDRYVRTGVIMFDSQGRLESVPLQFGRGSALGLKLGPQPAPPAVPPGLTVDVPPAGVQFFTQVGVVLYDEEKFLTQNGASEGDWVTRNTPGAHNGIESIPSPPGASFSISEQPEETWLDQNATPLYLNRYNGAVLKGE